MYEYILLDFDKDKELLRVLSLKDFKVAVIPYTEESKAHVDGIKEYWKAPDTKTFDGTFEVQEVSKDFCLVFKETSLYNQILVIGKMGTYTSAPNEHCVMVYKRFPVEKERDWKITCLPDVPEKGVYSLVIELIQGKYSHFFVTRVYPESELYIVLHDSSPKANVSKSYRKALLDMANSVTLKSSIYRKENHQVTVYE